MQDWHWWVGIVGALIVAVAGSLVWFGTLLTKIVAMLTKLEIHAESTKGHGATLANHETRITVLESGKKADQSGGWRRHDAE